MHIINLISLYQNGHIEKIDLAFGRLLQRLDPEADPGLGLIGAWVSRAAGRGHVCIDLSRVESELASDLHEEISGFDRSLSHGLATLHTSRVVGAPGAFRPLILDGQRLYLHRLWSYEHDLTQNLLDRMRQIPRPAFKTDRIADVIGPFLSDPTGDQYQAALVAAAKSFTVITGGPGSGKTYTIARIILTLKALSNDFPLRIWLAAPTGKAASRLQGAISAAMTDLNLDPVQALAGVHKARTLHRLLGYMPAAGRFRYNAEQPLPADMVIVDEASMVDLSLMARLVAAVPVTARLILVGDKDQLSSVEAGAVLGDICHALTFQPRVSGAIKGRADSSSGLSSMGTHIVTLTHNFRFSSQSSITELCRAVNAGDAPSAMSLLQTRGLPDLKFQPADSVSALRSALAEWVAVHIAPLFALQDAAQALDYLKHSKILAVVRKGPFGVQGLNACVEDMLVREALIPAADPWYPFRPVMINSNDYANALFNGDVGVVQKTALGFVAPDPVQVAFEDDQGGLRMLAPHQLPDHETVHAMTVHKSQGSEFDHVLLILPNRDVPVLTRELIYTAITRARKSVAIWGQPDLLAAAIRRRIQRSSGLSDALSGWKPIDTG